MYALAFILAAMGFIAGRHMFAKFDPQVENQTIFDFTVTKLDSEENIDLSSLRGKKAYLLVNVASECRLTDRNYAELNELYSKYKDHGLEIWAFPCNDFKKQESMCEADISTFAHDKKGAKFPIFGKLECENRQHTHPLFQYLKQRSPFGWSEMFLGQNIKLREILGEF